MCFLDRFHSVYSIGRDLQTDISGSGETDKTAGNIQARSFMARALDKIGKKAKLKEKERWSHEKFHLENARILRGIYFIDPEDKEFKETIQNARRNRKHQWLLPCPAKL